MWPNGIRVHMTVLKTLLAEYFKIETQWSTHIQKKVTQNTLMT